jgi:hypothetical protein
MIRRERRDSRTHAYKNGILLAKSISAPLRWARIMFPVFRTMKCPLSTGIKMEEILIVLDLRKQDVKLVLDKHILLVYYILNTLAH